MSNFHNNVRNYWQNRSKNEKFLWSGMTELNCNLIDYYLEGLDIYQGSILDLGAIAKHLSERFNVTAVDYIGDYVCALPNWITGICCDLRDFRINQKFDVILLFGILNYLKDDLAVDLLDRCRGMLKDNGTILVKHQCSRSSEDVVIEKFSEELGDHYNAIYRSVDKELGFYSKIGNISVHDPYSSEYNRWLDTFFKLFVIRAL